MIRKLKNRIKKISSSKSGLSLVELVVAVAILAALSSILLHSFVTSNTTTNKARRIGEATDAAQNIQETIESMRVSEFLKAGVTPDADGDGNVQQNPYLQNVQKLLSLTSDSVFALGPTVQNVLGETTSRCATITNITSGKSKFDAKITFSNGTVDIIQENGQNVVDLSSADGFYLINSVKVADYVTPDITFLQPFKEYDNPDNLADETFKSDRSNYKSIITKDRQITFNIGLDETGGVDVIAEWKYSYLYSVKPNKNSTTDHIEDEIQAAYSTYTTKSESIVLAGQERPEGEDFITIYFMYYPSYSDAVMRNTANGNWKDYVVINNPSDLNVRIILVKQIPMIKNLITGDYTQMNLITSGLSDYDMTDVYANYENHYSFTVDEYHSNDYIDNFDISVTPPTLMTNAGIQLQTLSSNAVLKCPTVIYRQRGKDNLGHAGLQQSTAEIIADGSLVNKQAFDRLYDVTIDIYSAGDLESEAPLYHASFKASRIN